MHKKTIKTIAATTTFAFCAGLMPVPAMAVNYNVITATEGVTTLTVAQVKDLAIIYNPTNKTYDLNRKIIELNEMMTRNNIRSIQYDLYDTVADNSKVEELQAQLNAATEAGQEDLTELEQQLAAAQAQYKQQQQQLDAKADAYISQIESLNKTLDNYAYEGETLTQTEKDWETQVSMIAEVLCMSILKAERNIQLQEENIALAEKALNLAKVQQELGMVLSVDVQNSQNSLNESKTQLDNARESLNVTKRKLNILIGRAPDTELEIKDYTPVQILSNIPTYSPELLRQVIANDNTMKKYDKSIADYRDSVKGVSASDTLQKAEYNIQQVQLNQEERKRTLEANIKAKLQTMRGDYAAYQNSMNKVVTARKNLEIAQTKYDLGMITGSQLMQTKITLHNAELTHWNNQCTYYLDWFEYKCMLNGTDTSSYSQYRI